MYLGILYPMKRVKNVKRQFQCMCMPFKHKRISQTYIQNAYKNLHNAY